MGFEEMLYRRLLVLFSSFIKLSLKITFLSRTRSKASTSFNKVSLVEEGLFLGGRGHTIF
jgi:hypothetical protein